MSEGAIAQYLDQLDRELRVKRAPRRRLLAEAADHLRASADDIAAAGVARVEAERQAVARFGAAALVARRFAKAAASTSSRTALVWTASACGGYVVAAAYFSLTAPSWLKDFPQGAPTMLALQVAAVALALSGLRALRFRKANVIDELRLSLIGNGVAISSLAVAGGAGLELLLALTRPAPAPWGDAVAVIAIYAVAATAAVVAAFVAVANVARTRALASPPAGASALPAAAQLLVDDVAATAAPLRPLAVVLTSRPALACGATAASAFAVVTVVNDLGSNYGSHRSALAGAAATGLVEAVAVVLAYVTLARALGLRSPRRRAAG